MFCKGPFVQVLVINVETSIIKETSSLSKDNENKNDINNIKTVKYHFIYRKLNKYVRLIYILVNNIVVIS